MERTRDELRGNMVMSSGEIDYIDVAENIRLARADVIEALDQFVRIGDFGMLALYKAPDQDVHWLDENGDGTILTTTQQEILSLTPDMEIGPNDTSILLSGKISNSRNQIQEAFVVTVIDGVPQVAEQQIIVQSNEQNKLFSFSSQLAGTYPAGTVVSFNFYAIQGGNLSLGGPINPTRVRMTKAQAAPVIANVDAQLAILIKLIENKADTEYVDKVIINTFSGTAEPIAMLGKNGDIYKRYPSDTPVSIMDEVSYANFDENNMFEIFYDALSLDLWQAKIHYAMNVLLLKYGANGTPDEHAYTLQIGNGTIYDLTVYGKNSVSVTLLIPPTASADMRSITTSTNIKIMSKQLTGQFNDYQKYDNKWFPNVVPFSRTTSTADFAHTHPTRDELTAIFDSEEHHDFAHPHDFFVNNSQGFFIVRYIPNGDTDIAGTNYKFYYESLTEAT